METVVDYLDTQHKLRGGRRPAPRSSRHLGQGRPARSRKAVPPVAGSPKVHGLPVSGYIIDLGC